jgi:hypothetical protein
LYEKHRPDTPTIYVFTLPISKFVTSTACCISFTATYQIYSLMVIIPGFFDLNFCCAGQFGQNVEERGL